MFQLLLESPGSRSRPAFAWGTGVAVLLHGAVAGLLLRSPAQAHPPARLIIAEPLPVPTRDPGPIVEPLVGSIPIGRASPLAPLPPVLIPALPPLSAQTGVGDDADRRALLPPGGTAGGAAPIASALAEEQPVLLAAPPPAYPPALVKAGVEGTVVVRLVVDTLGQVEPGTVRIVRCDQPELAGPAAHSLRLATFRPARVAGRAVRVLVEVPVQFHLRR